MYIINLLNTEKMSIESIGPFDNYKEAFEFEPKLKHHNIDVFTTKVLSIKEYNNG